MVSGTMFRALLAQAKLQQRMPRGLQIEVEEARLLGVVDDALDAAKALVLRSTLHRLTSETGPHAVKLCGKLRDGLMRVRLSEYSRAEEQRLRLCGDSARHRDEDAMDLRLLFIEQPRELVVVLDGLHRLDEDSLAAGA